MGPVVEVLIGMASRLAATGPLCALFTSAGIAHFLKPNTFLGIMRGMPLPALHLLAVYVTGVLEVGLGLAVLVHPSPKVCYALIGLVALMTPANINMSVCSCTAAAAAAVTFTLVQTLMHVASFSATMIVTWTLPLILCSFVGAARWWNNLSFNGYRMSPRHHLLRALAQAVLFGWLYLLSLYGHKAAGFYQKER